MSQQEITILDVLDVTADLVSFVVLIGFVVLVGSAVLVALNVLIVLDAQLQDSQQVPLNRNVHWFCWQPSEIGNRVHQFDSILSTWAKNGVLHNGFFPPPTIFKLKKNLSNTLFSLFKKSILLKQLKIFLNSCIKTYFISHFCHLFLFKIFENQLGISWKLYLWLSPKKGS